MQLQIISINALIISLLIDVRRSSNQKSFNVKFHSIQSFHNIITTVRTSNLSDNLDSQTKQSLSNTFDLDDLDSAVLLQSKRCSIHEIQEKLQCFEDLPQDRYDVLHNSSVIIKCVVRNQHGKVQWRAQNVVLGYDRSVPGMERLSIVGDASKGEHNLQISNIQPEDSGEYECQVQPVLRHPLLRKKTQVLVQVLPTSPVIVYRHKKLTDQTLIITPATKTDPSQDPKLILECQTSGAISHVQFIWYWNRQVVSESNRPEVAITSLSNNSSQIELRIDQLKSNDKIQCRVENKATRMMRKVLKNYSELSVTVNIQFYSFPGQPNILNSSFIFSNKFEEKEKLNIICQVSPIGSPIPEIKWYWYFNKISMLQYENLNFHNLIGNSVEIKSHRITVDSYRDELITKIYGLRLSKLHHAANITCAVKQVLLKSNVLTTIRIQVKHPPSMLKIYLFNQTKMPAFQTWDEYIISFDSIKSNHSVSLVEGKFYRFACSTNLHYTTLNINWSLALKENTKEQYNLENTRQTEIIVGDFYKQTTAFVDLKANKEIINMDLMCTAWPMDSIILTASLRIRIFYAPESPVLTGYSYTESVNEYESINLMCTTKGGYPLPDLIWYKENATLSNAEPIVSNEDRISSMLSFKVSREDNGKFINCAARNIATSNLGIPSNSVAIRTIFPARHVKIRTTPVQLKQITENSAILFTCETDSSNPASDIQWWLIRCAFPARQKLVKRQVPCSKNRLKEIHREVISGDFNGWKTVSKLQYIVKWLDNENFIECQSMLPNSDRTTSSLQHDRLRLNVIFAPHFFRHLQNESTIEAQENSQLVVNLKCHANPKPVRYVWARDKSALKGNVSFHFEKNTLTIDKVTRAHSGNYSLSAENDIGKSEIKFFLDVTYPPSIIGNMVEHIPVGLNKDLTVKCDISANPYSTNHLKWRISYPVDILSPLNVSEEWYEHFVQDCNGLVTWRLRNESWQPSASINCSTPKQFSTISNYHIANSSQFQSVILQCYYDNNIPSPAMRNFILRIDSPPQYQIIRQFAFQGVANDEAATFTCVFKGYPITTVDWHNCTSLDRNYMDPITNGSVSSWISNITLLSQSTDIYQIRPNLYRAEKEIWQRDWRMLNRICCQAVNIFGSDIGLITVLTKSKPQPPENIKIHKISFYYIIIKWDQGYDGGSAQDFQIKVSGKEKNHKTYQYDIAGNRYRNSLFYNISGLLTNACYIIYVGAFNKVFSGIAFAASIEACTQSDPNSLLIHRVKANIKTNITHKITNTPKINYDNIQKSTSFIVTVAGCVFGFVIVIINVLTFVICYKKKRERIRKRRQSKENQSTDDRQTENLSKFDSSMLENNLYDGSILAASDTCYIAEHRDKEEEIPMLVYQKPICPLHFVSNDQFSNPLIIQDHYLQSAINFSQANNRNETSCYGCTSIELPLNSVILSNQYLQFPLLESTYNSLLRNSCDYSLAPNIAPSPCSEFRNFNDSLPNDSRAFLDGDLSSKIPLSLQPIHLSSTSASVNPSKDPYQTIFRKPTITTDKQSIRSPIIHRGFSSSSGSN